MNKTPSREGVKLLHRIVIGSLRLKNERRKRGGQQCCRKDNANDLTGRVSDQERNE